MNGSSPPRLCRYCISFPKTRISCQKDKEQSIEESGLFEVVMIPMAIRVQELLQALLVQAPTWLGGSQPGNIANGKTVYFVNSTLKSEIPCQIHPYHPMGIMQLFRVLISAAASYNIDAPRSCRSTMTLSDRPCSPPQLALPEHRQNKCFTIDQQKASILSRSKSR